MLSSIGLLALACLSVVVAAPAKRDDLPIIDLGYSVHRATINETGAYYNFSNIRYAAPPTGDRRFAAPIVPTVINRTINDGQTGSICAQAEPYWEEVMASFLAGASTATIDAVGEEVEAAEAALTIAGLAAPELRTSEDCLFLDVITPTEAIESDYANNGHGLPVLVWVYGGGYTLGDKNESGNPAGLLARAKENGSKGLVFVAMNYRLGLFGWMSGSTFSGEGGLPNAGLYDQRLAFEWVQKNIHLFGGDPTRVTVIGESAGAGSIMHHITAYGGEIAPFAQAILQSPAFDPVATDFQENTTWDFVISQAQSLISSNVTDLASLRKLDFNTLAGLNTIIVARSAPYGTFTFGPVVDRTFVPEMPGKLLLEGKFDKGVKIMTAHNSNEGAVFTSPFITTDADFKEDIEQLFAATPNTTIDYMVDTLYPAVYNGTYPWTSVYSRSNIATAEICLSCNSRYINTGFFNETHSYLFTASLGLHGEDIQYTFFNGDTTTTDDGYPVNATVADALQRYITNFATNNGDPNGEGVPFFPKYQSNATVLVLGTTGIGALTTDPVANNRCEWLQQALYA